MTNTSGNLGRTPACFRSQPLKQCCPNFIRIKNQLSSIWLRLLTKCLSFYRKRTVWINCFTTLVLLRALYFFFSLSITTFFFFSRLKSRFENQMLRPIRLSFGSNRCFEWGKFFFFSRLQSYFLNNREKRITRIYISKSTEKSITQRYDWNVKCIFFSLPRSIMLYLYF